MNNFRNLFHYHWQPVTDDGASKYTVKCKLKSLIVIGEEEEKWGIVQYHTIFYLVCGENICFKTPKLRDSKLRYSHLPQLEIYWFCQLMHIAGYSRCCISKAGRMTRIFSISHKENEVTRQHIDKPMTKPKWAHPQSKKAVVSLPAEASQEDCHSASLFSPRKDEQPFLKHYCICYTICCNFKAKINSETESN